MDTKKMSLGDRMKGYYEEAYKVVLPMRMPVILRLDGRCFHTLTRKMDKPFDTKFIGMMSSLAMHLCHEVATAQMAYIQSDEISLLLHNYKRLTSQAWFGNEIQKIVSVSAGAASAYFSLTLGRYATFDSRTFVLPEAEVCNYFIWRQQDAIRNSVQALAQSLYSAKQLYKRDQSELLAMCDVKEKPWRFLRTHLQRGFVIGKWRKAEMDT